MKTKIIFTVQGQLHPFTEVVESTDHLTDQQAKDHIKKLIVDQNVRFRDKLATFKIVSLITE